MAAYKILQVATFMLVVSCVVCELDFNSYNYDEVENDLDVESPRGNSIKKDIREEDVIRMPLSKQRSLVQRFLKDYEHLKQDAENSETQVHGKNGQNLNIPSGKTVYVLYNSHPMQDENALEKNEEVINEDVEVDDNFLADYGNTAKHVEQPDYSEAGDWESEEEEEEASDSDTPKGGDDLYLAKEGGDSDDNNIDEYHDNSDDEVPKWITTGQRIVVVNKCPDGSKKDQLGNCRPVW